MSKKMGRVVVFGASGFVGTSVTQALRRRGADVVTARTPRSAPTPEERIEAAIEQTLHENDGLVELMTGADAVVNAAGDPDASSLDREGMIAANAVVPGVLAALCTRAGVPRFVHISSAVVLNDAPVLDDSPPRPGFSPYSSSKVRGEEWARTSASAAVVYRPPSVHARDRRVTRTIRKLAASPFRTVAAPGTAPTPQALRDNVGDAVAFLALTAQSPPPVVSHPWEGLTTSDLMELLGGKRPRRLPATLCRLAVASGRLVGRGVPSVAANTRRAELLWFGQGQAPSWLDRAGWTPPVGREGWHELANPDRAPDAPTGTIPGATERHPEK